MYIYTLNIGELGWVRRICESIDPNLTLAKKKKKIGNLTQPINP